MKHFRGTATVLVTACLMTLTACGGEGGSTEAGSTPPAATPTAAASSAPVAATGAEDKKICTDTNAANTAMTQDLVKRGLAAGADEKAATAALQGVMADFAANLETIAGDGKSAAATAVRKFAAETAKAGATIEGIDDPAFEDSYKDVVAVCATAGVTLKE